MNFEDKKCACRLVCRCTKFVPTTVPRLSIYCERENVWRSDLKKYNEHLKRCFYAKPVVDTSAPRMNLEERLKIRKMIGDAFRAMEIDRDNRSLLKNLITIQRLGGRVDTVNPNYRSAKTRWPIQKNFNIYVERENKKMYKRMKRNKSLYVYDHKDWLRWLKDLKEMCRFPLNALKKTDLDKEVKGQPSISSGLKTSAHDQCFMDFTVKNGEFLGTIWIELYQEIAPVTVQNFLALCKGYNEMCYKNCPVYRIEKDQFMETGDVTKGTGAGGCSVYGESFDEENHKLKHSRTGTVSMVRVKDSQKNNSKFCITFCPQEKLDRKNVVFGKVIKGVDVLMKINGYGRKIGKPLVEILITNCGEFPQCTCRKRRIICK